MDGSPKIEIKTLAWDADRYAATIEEANTTLSCRVFINGQEIPGVNKVRVLADQDFTYAVLRLIGVITVEPITKEEWNALDALPPR